MNWREISNRLRYLGRRDRFDRLMAEEMEQHLELRAEELEAEGLPPAEARRRARLEFGPVARLQEDTRAAWQFRWLEDLLSDLRYAARSMRHSPGFALAGICSLALGAGLNTTVFSLTAEFLLSEPSVSSPSTLVAARLGGRSHAELREFRFLRDSGLFDGVAGIREESEANWRDGSETRRLFVARTTDNFFQVTGTPVALGRGTVPGELNTVVLHNAFWKEHLHSDPSILGRLLVLDGRPYTVVGVLPEDHRSVAGFGYSPSLYLPIEGENEVVKLHLRLPAGVGPEAALARIRALSGRLDRLYPPEGGEPRARDAQIEEFAGAGRLKSKKMMPVVAFFSLLMIVVGLVLLVACANVAGLHLARAAARRQELSIRVALGAGRSRVIRQLLAESLLLAALGTLAGLALNILAASFLNQLRLPFPVPIRLSMHADPRLLFYSMSLAVGSALLCGLMPALAAARSDINSNLRSEGRSTVNARFSARNLVVALQLTVTVVLLVAGTLFYRNLAHSALMHPGFDANQTIWATLRLAPQPAGENVRAGLLLDRVLEELRALPGVQSASEVEVVPLNDSHTRQTRIFTDLDPNGATLRMQLNRVGSDYFRTMGIALIAGRSFLPADSQGGEPSVVINQTLARRLFGNTSAVGHQIKWESQGSAHALRIVGVARDSKYMTLGEENVPAYYEPTRLDSLSGSTLHIMLRTAQPPAQLVRPVRDRLLALDPTAAAEVQPMSQGLAMAFLPSRVGALVLGISGILGLLLAATGLYSVLAYAVSRRTREIGLRVALGANPAQVLAMILRQSLTLVAASLAVGLLIAFGAMQPLALFLVPGIRPSDPINYAAVAVLLLAVATLATTGPSLRALRVSPATALRDE